MPFSHSKNCALLIHNYLGRGGGNCIFPCKYFPIIPCWKNGDRIKDVIIVVVIIITISSSFTITVINCWSVLQRVFRMAIRVTNRKGKNPYIITPYPKSLILRPGQHLAGYKLSKTQPPRSPKAIRMKGVAMKGEGKERCAMKVPQQILSQTHFLTCGRVLMLVTEQVLLLRLPQLWTPFTWLLSVFCAHTLC